MDFASLYPSYALYLDAAKQGMADMSKKFLDMKAEVYVDQAAVVKESNGAMMRDLSVYEANGPESY